VMLFLAAYTALLHHHSGSDDLAVGLPVANRTEPGTRSMVGTFVNMRLVRADLTGDPDLTELVRRTTAAVRAGDRHDIPFQALVELLPAPRPPGVPPGYQLAVNHTPAGSLGAPVSSCEEDLLLDIADGTARLVYDTALFDRATVDTLLADYVRMLATLLDAPGTRLSRLRADPEQNMSDISFAVERHVQAGATPPFPAWHVDRSRNDLQVCAQLMAARDNLGAVAADLAAFGHAVTALAARYTDTPMPGHTHGQAAQIITPGYHLAALAAETSAALRRTLHTYDEIDACPLGSGAMAGQELPWDRTRLAELLGFARTQPHALVGVASRTWTTAIATDLASYAAVLSRFTTDLMTWSGAGFGFLDLPDELAGISAAMPQKRNFPVLERIRGRCAHVVGRAADLVAGQRNTPYTNTVEVSKETGAHLHVQAVAMRSLLRLAHAVVNGATFRTERMRAPCAEDHHGGFTLANRLTLDCGSPR
ncbi:lyase family protein, partial [Streptomyces sp. NPDC059142]|uniref:lyase family protein n=1 Tax=Streptomyces sp. NPDC059142 TaxID=3346739 RepID=UPI0036A91E4E